MRFLFNKYIPKKFHQDIVAAIKKHPKFKKGYNTKKLDGMTLTMDASPPEEFLVKVLRDTYLVSVKAFDGEIYIRKERV